MTTLRTLVNRVNADARMVDGNPNMTDMPSGSTHWAVTLRYQGRQMTVPFSQGPAICREPMAADVLECLLSESDGSAASFEDWCEENGFDTDSRKAERIYKTVVKQSAELRQFLGNDYETFLYAER